jgi:hypothetical protein
MFLYGEAVKQRSPGSRSAPWATSTRGFQTLKETADLIANTDVG